MGFAGTSPLCNIVISDLVSQRVRGVYSAFAVLAMNLGLSFGGPIGTLLDTRIGWRWAFGAQIPLCVLALVGFATLVRIPGTGEAKVDWLGASLSILTLGFLATGLQLGGGHFDWSSPIVVSCLAGAVITATLFVFAEQRAVQPIVKLSVLVTTARQTLATLLGAVMLL